jgi:hypothetical protein
MDGNSESVRYFSNSDAFHNDYFGLKKRKNQVFFEPRFLTKLGFIHYYVYITNYSNVWQSIGDRNMGKIINFCEARQKLELSGLASALKWERDKPPEPEKPYTGPTKKPRIISALPGETIPPEFPDFRPYLQRDGLILLGWSRWDNHKEYGLCYRVNWVKSCGKCRYYSSGAFWYDIFDAKEMKEATPCRGGDVFWRQGIAGKPHNLKYVYNKDMADYVFACAPWDLNSRTMPGFIEELKAAGVTVNFDFPFSMDYVKKLEFVAVLQKCTAVSPQYCAWGQEEGAYRQNAYKK